jgi:hypothetical protein
MISIILYVKIVIKQSLAIMRNSLSGISNEDWGLSNEPDDWGLDD